MRISYLAGAGDKMQRYMEQDAGLNVKENVVGGGEGVGARGLLAVAAGALLAVVAAVALDAALPSPLSRGDLAGGGGAGAGRFIAELAHEHLANLTAVGPRPAGSYELEVAGVGAAVAALRAVAGHLAPQHALQWEVWREPGRVAAFPLAFLDGMNHVYRDVTSVVALLRPAAASRRPHRPALLLNCHLDTVPDSPGASDDAAGCAVLLETVRALGAGAGAGAPLDRDVVLLMNGAEENVLQASHAFVTRHRWARRARLVLNLEACGAGGREVLFQAGPHDAWLVEAYARHAPHPFASSLAQELFASGLVPAETDFRVFREHGALSGLDLAWSARGHVYHTRLDAPALVPRAALQRAGDNVLAVARALLADPRLDAPPDTATPLPLYFDVLGLVVVRLGAGAALAAAALLVLAVLAAVHGAGGAARARLGVTRAAWAGACARGAVAVAAAGAGGALAAGALGLALHAQGARMRWYARPELAVALFAPVALGAMGAVGARLAPRPAGWARGAWAGRAMGAGGALLAAALTAACAARGLRSGFVPALWAAAGAGGLGGGLAVGGGRAWVGRWSAWAALPMLQTCYMSLGFVRMFVPVAGRAGPSLGPLPPDVAIGAMVGALTAWCCAWSVPLWATAEARGRWSAAWALWAVSAAAALAALCVEPYSAEAPQRLMVFHTRRTTHAPPAGAAGFTPPPHVEHFYWAPELDVNTRDTFHRYFPGAAGGGGGDGGEECARWVYCGLPYYLPVLALLPAAVRAPAPPFDAGAGAALRLRLDVAERTDDAGRLAVTVHGELVPAHAVLIVRVAGGGRVARLEAGGAQLAPLAAAPGVYFVSVFSGRARPWTVTLHLAWPGPGGGAAPPAPGRRAQLSAAGHALFGPQKATRALLAALDALPPTVAATSWTVDHHLYVL